jgi:hypothetical protein
LAIRIGSPRAATKLFTVGCSQSFAALAWPTMNNFG